MTLEQTKVALAKLRLDAERIEPTLHRLAAAAIDPATHARLHRAARVVSELRAVLETPVPLA
jgi:hypothetical protein